MPENSWYPQHPRSHVRLSHPPRAEHVSSRVAGHADFRRGRHRSATVRRRVVATPSVGEIELRRMAAPGVVARGGPLAVVVTGRIPPVKSAIDLGRMCRKIAISLTWPVRSVSLWLG